MGRTTHGLHPPLSCLVAAPVETPSPLSCPRFADPIIVFIPSTVVTKLINEAWCINALYSCWRRRYSTAHVRAAASPDPQGVRSPQAASRAVHSYLMHACMATIDTSFQLLHVWQYAWYTNCTDCRYLGSVQYTGTGTGTMVKP